MDENMKIVILQQMMDGDDTSDNILSAYLHLAGQSILNRLYPFRESYEGLDVPDKFSMLQIKIACYMLNKRGAEGEIQHIENGIHRNYGNADIPEQMLTDVVPFCQVIR